MENKQVLGLDKFHQCLSIMFPPDDPANDACDSDPAKRKKGDCVDNSERDPVRRHIPVRFTKNAVELLREILNGFLRAVGNELDDGDRVSQHPIRVEDVVRALLAMDDDDNNHAISDNGEEISNEESMTMKAIVAQAQNLLLERKRREIQHKNLESETPNAGAEMENEVPSSPSERRAASSKTNERFSKSHDAKSETTLSHTRHKQQKQRKRKRKKNVITPEMEAEQERLLNASKRAFESSQQQQGQQGGGAATFRVELS